MRALIVGLASVGLVSCAGQATSVSAGRRNPDASQIRVEVYRGVTDAAIELPRPHLVLDVTPMIESSRPVEGQDLMQPAQQMLARLRLGPTAAGQPLVHPFHRSAPAPSDEACPANPQAMSHASGALMSLSRELARASSLDGAQVVLITDLSTECAPALCAAASELVAQGAWIDVVQVGPGKAPACMEEIRPSLTEPASLRGTLHAEPPKFRIESAPSDGGPDAVLRGTAQDPALDVAPGYHMVIVEMEPEEIIGPVRLQRGDRATVRVMDFPLSAPDAREWSIEVENADR